MRVFWRRGNDKLSFTEPKTHFILGQVGVGKSTLLEHIGTQYLEQGAVLLDLYGSADGEGLAWLRSPYIEEKKVLLVKGENVDVKSSFESKTVEKITLSDLERYDIILSARPLFMNRDAEYFSIGAVINLLYRRLSWHRVICLLAREASSLWYSRIMVSESQTDMKNEALYMLREMRHMGIGLVLDSLRLMGVDVDLRSHVDYMYLKSQGIESLSHDLFFLYSFFDPTFIRSMKPWEFVLITRTGSLGCGWFENHEWHKRVRENILASVDLEIEYGVELEKSEDRGTFRTVGDKEHSEIISMYVLEKLSMTQIAKKLGRSSRTTMVHLHSHNDSITRSGFCASCKRVGNQFQNKRTERTTTFQTEQAEQAEAVKV